MRPGCIEFLKDLTDKYEIVIFTAATKEVIYVVIISMLIL